jgi:7-cyano-7-deazaguanine synthase in queuosine biosynthesis
MLRRESYRWFMIVLLSGGPDSIAAWRLLGLPRAVHFDLGTVAIIKERQALDWAEEAFGTEVVYRTLIMGDHETDNGYLPFRNSILILSAAQLDHEVVLGQVAEWAPDKNFRFYKRLEKAVNMAGTAAAFEGGLHITAPFAGLSKGELLAEYCRQFGDLETGSLLRHTWSCYRDERVHCGKCGGCEQRYAGEAQLRELTNVMEQTPFATVPEGWTIPLDDGLSWIRDNRLSGVRQILALRRQERAGQRATHRPERLNAAAS